MIHVIWDAITVFWMRRASFYNPVTLSWSTCLANGSSRFAAVLVAHKCGKKKNKVISALARTACRKCQKPRFLRWPPGALSA
jgi:hypothetical protein